MPLYEITLITRPLAKTELVTTLTRAANTLFDNGAVISNAQSLGHRDMPYRRRPKNNAKESFYATNFFMFETYMNRKSFLRAFQELRNDQDLVHIGHVVEHDKAEQPTECKLEDLLKPPAYRESVQKLRDIQKMAWFSKWNIYRKTEREWRAVPKSYPIQQQRI